MIENYYIILQILRDTHDINIYNLNIINLFDLRALNEFATF